MNGTLILIFFFFERFCTKNREHGQLGGNIGYNELSSEPVKNKFTVSNKVCGRIHLIYEFLYSK